MSALASLEPRSVWTLFDQLCAIPRPSHREEQAVAWVRAWADRHDFGVRADAFGNLIVDVPARAGAAPDAPIVVLQGHLDMVGEKNHGVAHDFATDPLEVEVVDGWVQARGTTLGADNGVGVAMAMAAATDPEVVHGPLELLLTLAEETGLEGAMAFDGGLLRGRLLINLDTEEDDSIYIGCAGARAVEATLPLVRRPLTDDGEAWVARRLWVRGLRGGHSGMEIGDGRGNAIDLMAQLLIATLEREFDLELVALAGGDQGNAIPRECRADLWIRRAQLEALETWLHAHREGLQKRFAGIDDKVDLTLELLGAPPGADPWTSSSRDAWLRLLDAAPYGVQAMSRAMPGLVETSTNPAVVRTDDSTATVLLASRSSSNPALDALTQQLISLARLAGASVKIRRGYPGWSPDPGSPLVAQAVAAYRTAFDAEPTVQAIHAGLECGVLVEKVPRLDAVSIGPDIVGPHSPAEKVRIASVERSWLLLSELLRRLSEI
ncbi:MAG: beta-Ala-His dipeptidase [Acidobacteriota bacterium]